LFGDVWPHQFRLCSAESLYLQRLGLQKAAHYNDFLQGIKECIVTNFAANVWRFSTIDSAP